VTSVPGQSPFPTEPLFPELLVKRGKVRDVYRAGDDRLVVIASDRISAFDVVLSPGVPGKGVVLTQLSNFWFSTLADVVPHHLVATELSGFPEPFASASALRGRASLVRALEIVPVECVVRGYIVGSGWKEYQQRGTVCGIALPAGLRQAERLAEPVFTPSTKASAGHDENITFDDVVRLVGGPAAEKLRERSVELYRRAASVAEERGIIIADTKFEFGRDPDGELVWADEALTPDSSRFWPRDRYRPGANPPSFDKQYVRDWLEQSGWNKQPPAPPLPPDVVAKTRELYLEAYRRLTGGELNVPEAG
jgi:phosphoribosylaminoimidazole-succinocarboxamide synthase